MLFLQNVAGNSDIIKVQSIGHLVGSYQLHRKIMGGGGTPAGNFMDVYRNRLYN